MYEERSDSLDSERAEDVADEHEARARLRAVTGVQILLKSRSISN